MNNPFEGRQIVKKDKLAKILSVSERTIDGWVARRSIPFIRINKQVLRFDVEDVLKSKTINPVKIESV